MLNNKHPDNSLNKLMIFTDIFVQFDRYKNRSKSKAYLNVSVCSIMAA